MTIGTTSPSPAVPSLTDATTRAASTTPTDTIASTPPSAKDLHNAQILQASMRVTIQAGNEGLTLLYRSAIDALNTILAPELGPDALQAAPPQAHTPEATALRIVSLSTAMFHNYAAQHPTKPADEAARDFAAILRTGFGQGYAEAEKILLDLGVLGSDSPIAQGLAQTHALVLQGFDDWLAQQIAPRPAEDA